jgi:hypothetical protein
MLWIINSIIQFYGNLLSQYLLAEYYREELILDENHPHYRRFSKDYQKKRGIVKNFWIGASLIALIFPVLHVALSLMLITTFVSFSILDETE